MNIAAILVSLLLAAALLFSAYGGRMDPTRSCTGAIAAMVFPVMLGLSLLLLVVNLIWFRRAAIVTGLSLLFCIGPIFTYCPLNIFRPSVKSIESSGKEVIKIMTYNMLNLVDYSKGFCRVGDGNPTMEYVLLQAPDILLCQEGENMLADDGSSNIDSLQHRRLVELYPYRKVDRRGMGILSRFPFTAERIDHSDRWQYDVVRYRITIGSRVITVFNLHLQSLGLTDNDKAMYRDLTNVEAKDNIGSIRTLVRKLNSAFRKRAGQARYIRQVIDRTDGTVIVCGDFNDIPGCYAQRVIAGDDLRDAYRSAGIGPAITYHDNRFFFRIDHILYRGPIKPLRVWCGSNPSSDHYPLIGWFELEDSEN